MAEQSGLILPLGDWVLRRACLDGRRWPGLRIAVNVSPIQFRQRDYVDSVVRILQETGFTAELVVLQEAVQVPNCINAPNGERHLPRTGTLENGPWMSSRALANKSQY